MLELHNIEWYNDKELSIFFDREPDVCVRTPSPEDDTLTRNSKLMFPFLNRKALKVAIFDHKKGKSYKFEIYKGYCYDGATIPRMFWRLIGAKSDPQFLIPALVHDVLCENHDYVDNDRNLSSRVFRALLIAGGVNKVKAQVMYTAVDVFQTAGRKWRN